MAKSNASEDFPRGGGSGLTPLEYRDVARQADADVAAAAFKESKQKKLLAKAGDKKNLQLKKKDNATQQKKKKHLSFKARDKAKRTEAIKEWDRAEQALKAMESNGAAPVEALSMKKLAPGVLLMGRIVRINELSVMVSLPNHLMGRVLITDISSELAEKISAAAAAAQEEEEDEDDEEEDDDKDAQQKRASDVPDLSQLFYIGQWVRVMVSKVSSNKKQQKHISLTMRPELINSRLASIDVVDGLTLPVSVKSIEDKGYIVTTGVSGAATGFLSNSNARDLCESYYGGRPLSIGQVVECAALHSSKQRGGVVQLTAAPSIVSASKPKSLSRVGSILPGLLVPALVESVTRGGLRVKFFGSYGGTIDSLHFMRGEESPEDYPVGTSLNARVLYVGAENSLDIAGTSERAVGLSLAPHIVNLQSRSDESTGYELPSNVHKSDSNWPVKYGTVFDKVEVIRVDSHHGLHVKVEDLPDWLMGFVHISRVSDDRTEVLPSSGKYRIGAIHKARVIGYDSADGIVQLSLQPSVLSAGLLRIEDAVPGSLVKAKIIEVTPEKGLSVGLLDSSGPVDGMLPAVIPPEHVANVKLSSLVSFKAGNTIKCRVLGCNKKNDSLYLTAKKTLIDSAHPVITSYNEASKLPVGTQLHGVVKHIKDGSGIVISFYNNVTAFAPVSELTDEGKVDRASALFTTGQVVLCRISGQLGSIVSATVHSVQRERAILSIDSPKSLKGARAILNVAHTSDHSNTHATEQLSKLAAGQSIKELVIIHKSASQNASSRAIIVSAKPLLVQAARQGKLMRKAGDLPVGSVVPGYVRSASKGGVFVALIGGASGLAPLSALSDQYVVDPAKSFTADQTVLALIAPTSVATSVTDKSAGKDESRIALSLRPSHVYPEAAKSRGSFDADFLRSYFAGTANVSSVIGTKVEATIEKMQSFGWTVTVRAAGTPLESIVKTETVSGLITMANAKGVTAPRVGSSVPAVVLDFDVEKAILDLSALADHVSAAGAAGAAAAGAADADSQPPASKKQRRKISELTDEGKVDRASALFTTGQVVLCRISGQLGSIVSATVHSVQRERAILSIDSPKSLKGARAILNVAHTSDHSNTHATEQLSKLAAGQSIKELVIIHKSASQNASSRAIIVSAKPLLVQAARQGKLMRKAGDLPVGSVVPGYVRSASKGGVFVALIGGASGLAPLSALSDQYVVDPAKSFTADQTVLALIAPTSVATSVTDKSAGKDESRIALSLRPSHVYPEAAKSRGSFDADFLRSYFAGTANVSSVIGTKVEATIEKMQSFGWTVTVRAAGTPLESIVKTETVSGLITMANAKGVTAPRVGSSVPAVVLDFDVEKAILDLSALADHVSAAGAAGAAAAGAADADSQPPASKKQRRKSGKSASANGSNSVSDLVAAAQEKSAPIDATVALVKEDYAVLSVPSCGGALVYTPVQSYNVRSAPFTRFKSGQRRSILIVSTNDGAAGGRHIARVLDDPALSLDGTTYADLKSKKKEAASESKPGSSVGRRAVTNAMDSRIKFFDDYTPGMVTTVKVRAVRGMQANLQLADDVQGRLHITELIDLDTSAEKLAELMQTINVEEVSAALKSQHQGNSVAAKVFAHFGIVNDAEIKVKVVGAHDPQSYKKRFFTHMTGNLQRMVVDTTLRASDMKLAEVGTKSDNSESALEVGDIIAGKIATDINRLSAGELSVLVHIGTGIFGRLHITDVADTYSSTPFADNFMRGQMIRCAVVGDHSSEKSKQHICYDLSTRDSRIFGNLAASLGGFGGDDDDDEDSDGASNEIDDDIMATLVPDREIDSIAAVKPGSIVQGYVKTVSSNGCFVSIGRNVVARVKISELSDVYVKDYAQQFPAGKFVRGRIVSIDTAGGKIEMTLRQSQLRDTNGSSAAAATTADGDAAVASEMPADASPWAREMDVWVGYKARGTVTQVKSFGIFVKMDRRFGSSMSATPLVGMCHVSEVADSFIDDITRVYKQGDRVRAVVLKIDDKKRRIILGMKASYFESGELAGNGEEEDDDDTTAATNGVGESSDEDASDSDMDVDSDIDDAATTSRSLGAEHDRTLNLMGFDWNTAADDADAADKDGSDQSDDDASDIDSAAAAVAADSKKQKDSSKPRNKTAAAQRKALEDISSELAAAAPKSATDYERLLLGSPNSSFLWINFMAYHLQLAEVERARQVAERALTTISYREESERENVLVAWLNLEHKFGSEDSLRNVFQRMSQLIDTEKAYNHMAQVYVRADDHEKAAETFKAMVRKFSTKRSAWTTYGNYMFRHAGSLRDQLESAATGTNKKQTTQLRQQLKQALDDARDVLQRSLRSLPKPEHVDHIAKFAQFEFKFGEAERGRTLFEGILTNYPKRLDLWNVYIDMEIGYGSSGSDDDEGVQHARRLFQRLLAMKLSSKKMKFVFKKYLAFEKQRGTEETVEEVKQRALAYIRSQTGDDDDDN
ncbi:hypothetical protein GQ42DRAFT_156453 [Ramicandelaber brevisporus]|nr:hypothetical protein GQ42DRAFT_156453 [Ramicandelaber brevisporus]